MFDIIIFKTTIIGTANNIPNTHHNHHHIIRDVIITSGLKFNLFHKKWGSIIFQIITCVNIAKDKKRN